MNLNTETKNRIQSLERGLELLILLSHYDSAVSLEQISKRIKFSKPTCFRLLQTMKRMNFVQQDPETKHYRIGPRNIAIGMAALNGQNVRSVALPYMRRIRSQTGETVNLTILDGNEIVFVERIEGKYIVNANLCVGSRLPVHCSSMGKAILAHLPDKKLSSVLETLDFRRFTENTIASRESFIQELATIREKGTSINNEELEKGLFAVAAPILDYSGEAVAALNVSFPLARHRIQDALDDFVPIIKETCMEISGLLGFKV